MEQSDLMLITWKEIDVRIVEISIKFLDQVPNTEIPRRTTVQDIDKR